MIKNFKGRLKRKMINLIGILKRGELNSRHRLRSEGTRSLKTMRLNRVC